MMINSIITKLLKKIHLLNMPGALLVWLSNLHSGTVYKKFNKMSLSNAKI